MKTLWIWLAIGVLPSVSAYAIPEDPWGEWQQELLTSCGQAVPKNELPVDIFRLSTNVFSFTGEVSPEVALYNSLLSINPDLQLHQHALWAAVNAFISFPNQVKKRDFFAFVDYGTERTQDRFFLIDVKSGRVAFKSPAADGRGNSKEAKFTQKVSLSPGSNMTPYGPTVATHSGGGKHGDVPLLHWPSGVGATKGLLQSRAIEIHPASYVTDGGRSLGCPALPDSKYNTLVKKILNNTYEGLLIYLDPGNAKISDGEGRARGLSSSLGKKHHRRRRSRA